MTVSPGVGRLRFRRHLRARTVPGDATYLVSTDAVLTLRGDHLERVAPLLDGSRSVAEVVDATGDLDVADVARCLRLLAAAGVLVEDSGPPAPRDAPEAAFWDLAAVPDPAVDVAARIEVRTVGPDARTRGVHHRVHRALAGAGLRVAGPGSRPDEALVVVLCDDLLDPALDEVAAEMRDRGVTWVPVRAAGALPSVGPFLDPVGPGPCFTCLTARLVGLRERRPPGDAPSVGLSAVDDVVLGLLALACGARLRGARHQGHDAVLRLDPVRLTLTAHPVRPRPECPTCGDPDVGDRTVVPDLRSRPRPPGERRARAAADVLADIAPLVDPVTGTVADDGPVDTGGVLWTWRARASVPPAAHRAAGGPAACAGVAPDPDAARLAALAEALERHSGSFHGDEPRRRARFADLPDAVHPDAVQLWDPRQQAGRAAWNAGHEPSARVGARFDADRPVDWTPLWSLTGGRVREVATGLLYHGADGAGGSLGADSSGVAAGGVLEDAVLSGLLELVERDAVAIWWYNRLPVPGLPLGVAGAGWVPGYVAELRRAGRECWALDLTTDLGVPVVAAVSASPDGSRIAFGFGAHLERGRALERALAEMHQLTLTLGAPGRPGAAARWWADARLAGHPHLAPAAVTPVPVAVAPSPDVLDDLEAVRGRVEAAGLEVLLLDQTRPSVGVPVVRVVVPGLRPMRPRFAPGRLFDVPVRTGRRAAPSSLEGLNPVPLFV